MYVCVCVNMYVCICVCVSACTIIFVSVCQRMFLFISCQLFQFKRALQPCKNKCADWSDRSVTTTLPIKEIFIIYRPTDRSYTRKCYEDAYHAAGPNCDGSNEGGGGNSDMRQGMSEAFS